jgi:hypothetical protein
MAPRRPLAVAQRQPGVEPLVDRPLRQHLDADAGALHLASRVARDGLHQPGVRCVNV